MNSKFSPFRPQESQLWTWDTEREDLENLGLSREEVDSLRRATSGKRFEERKLAAHTAANHYLNWKDLGGKRADAWKALLYAIEVNGIGGRGQAGKGLEGSGTPCTLRHPAFSGLGTGRRHALDGGAWDAAISAMMPRLDILAVEEGFQIQDPSWIPTNDRILFNGPVVIGVEQACTVLGREWVGAYIRARYAHDWATKNERRMNWAQLLIRWTQTPPDPEPPKEEEEPPNGEL